MSLACQLFRGFRGRNNPGQSILWIKCIASTGFPNYKPRGPLYLLLSFLFLKAAVEGQGLEVLKVGKCSLSAKAMWLVALYLQAGERRCYSPCLALYLMGLRKQRVQRKMSFEWAWHNWTRPLNSLSVFCPTQVSMSLWPTLHLYSICGKAALRVST